MTPRERALRVILGNEAGYANDRHDPGKETYRGISRRYHPEFVGWPRLDALKARGLVPAPGMDDALDQAVYDFYYQEYIEPFAELPAPLLIGLADYAVHHGLDDAIRALQSALKVKVDGDLGDATQAAARGAALLPIIFRIQELRARHMGNWIQERPPQRVRYVEGFMVRLVRVADEMVRAAVA